MFKYYMTVLSTQWSTRPLREHEVIKVCSIEYFNHRVELVLPAFKFWYVRKIIKYLTLGLSS